MTELIELVEAFFAQSPTRVALDVADVLVVAFLVYRVLLLVRGTRAMQMAVGLGLVFVAYQASRQLGLYTLYTLLDAFLTYIVLLVVVLFQNDIRRVLTRVGTRPFFRGARHPSSSRPSSTRTSSRSTTSSIGPAPSPSSWSGSTA